METLVISKSYSKTLQTSSHINSNHVINGVNIDKVYAKQKLCKLYKKVLANNLNVNIVKKMLRNRRTYECFPKVKMKDNFCYNYTNISSDLSLFKYLINSRFLQSLFSLMIVIITIYVRQWDHLISSRCALYNNYFVMEMTRPPTNCDICRNVNQFLVLENITKDEFAKYAYNGQPIVVRGASKHWSALKTFSFDFFRQIYSQNPGAYESIERECQFFPFKTQFNHLSQVFAMPEERVRMTEQMSKPWYIGWSNCNAEIASILRQHYSRPTFLPDDSESSAIDRIFMGYSHIGASMHLDYVQRPSWQAQVSGSKTWHLLPPPECEPQCKPINITVQTGDIILIDTNQWYHKTGINAINGISITIGSEYD
ncbi:uncharacterized protein LOC128958033 [Oppia nitens]|uniref:uncharacterized protein LOC128958033 n=1 Tax=Oppia nitens TaxID=1686743 RepID=UPI0023DA708E|nr:uncharacterized protein LOC128958033 [Oppia nitens]